MCKSLAGSGRPQLDLIQGSTQSNMATKFNESMGPAFFRVEYSGRGHGNDCQVLYSNEFRASVAGPGG
jgi:hypothetical protein